MNNKFQTIIVDLNNLFWRCFSVSLKKFFVRKDYDIFPGSIRESLTRIEHIKNIFAYDSSILYLVLDNPNSVLDIRRFIDCNYKSHRFKRNAPKGLYQTLNIFIEVLKNYSNNFKIVQCESLEADDLTKPIISSLNLDKKSKCLCISNDLDWARNLSLSEHVYWWNYHKLYNQEDFKEEYKYPAICEKIQLYKAIHGDASDNIENAVPYLPSELLIRIVNEFNSVEDLYKGLWKTDYPQQWKIKLKENERDVRKNLQLVDFAPLDFDIKDNIFDCKQNSSALKFFYDALDLDYEPFMKKEKNVLFQKIKYKRI